MSKADKPDVVSALCTRCPDPGRCCRGFFFSFRFKGFKSKASITRWLREHGLPFVPRQRYRDGRWRFDCPLLTDEGRCSDYANRPYACRVFVPGRDMICATTIARRGAKWKGRRSVCR